MKKTAPNLINKIVRLRKLGLSIDEISKRLNVPKTTVFRYAAKVVIPSELRNLILLKKGGSLKRKLLKEKIAQQDARKIVKKLKERDFILFLSALYWGEGSKADFGLSNTDPKLIEVFVKGLNKFFDVGLERISASVRIYEDLDREKCLDFWSNVVGIPKEKFISVNVISGKKNGKLEYGMCRIRVKRGGDLLKMIKSINSLISESMPL